MKSNRGRVIRDLGVLALSIVIIVGLVLLERVNFPKGGDVFRYPLLARLQGNTRQIISCEEIIYQRAKIAGHRGSAVKGETMIDGELEITKIGNTKQGIEKAVEEGVDFIEIDLRTFAGDERDLVLYHDSNLGKLILPEKMREPVPLRIEDLKATEIKGSTYRTTEKDRVVFFSEFLELIAGSKQKIILDLKFSDHLDGRELTVAFDKMVDQMNQHPKAYESVIIFGDYEVLREWRSYVRTRVFSSDFAPQNFQIGYTVLAKHPRNRLDVLLRPTQVFERLEQLSTTDSEPILVLPACFASNAMLKRANERDLEVWVYGTDEIEDLCNLNQRGVDGFILDNPKASPN